MPLRVQCPNGCVMRVPANRAGMSARCPGCKSVVVIPFPPTGYQPDDMLTAVAASSAVDSLVAEKPAEPKAPKPIPTASNADEPTPTPMQRPKKKKSPNPKPVSTTSPSFQEPATKDSNTRPADSSSTDEALVTEKPKPKKKRKRKRKKKPATVAPELISTKPLESVADSAPSIALKPKVAGPEPGKVESPKPPKEDSVQTPPPIKSEPVRADSPQKELETSMPIEVAKKSSNEFTNDTDLWVGEPDSREQSTEPVEAFPDVNVMEPVESLPNVAASNRSTVVPATFSLDVSENSGRVKVAAESNDDTNGLSAIEIRTRRANADRVTLTRFFAAMLVFVGLVNFAPAIYCWYTWSQNDIDFVLPRWIYLQIFIAILHLVYAVLLLQVPDWSTLRSIAVVMLAFAFVFGLFSMGLLATGSNGLLAQFLQVPGSLGRQACIWCVAMLCLATLASYLAGRESNAWQRTEKLLAEILANKESA